MKGIYLLIAQDFFHVDPLPLRYAFEMCSSSMNTFSDRDALTEYRHYPRLLARLLANFLLQSWDHGETCPFGTSNPGLGTEVVS